MNIEVQVGRVYTYLENSEITEIKQENSEITEIKQENSEITELKQETVEP